MPCPLTCPKPRLHTPLEGPLSIAAAANSISGSSRACWDDCLRRLGNASFTGYAELEVRREAAALPACEAASENRRRRCCGSGCMDHSENTLPYLAQRRKHITAAGSVATHRNREPAMAPSTSHKKLEGVWMGG